MRRYRFPQNINEAQRETMDVIYKEEMPCILQPLDVASKLVSQNICNLHVFSSSSTITSYHVGRS